jgi:kynurenine aminotransferase
MRKDVRNVTFCGGKPVYVPLRPPANAGTQNVSSKEWTLDIDELKAALTPKSKVMYEKPLFSWI